MSGDTHDDARCLAGSPVRVAVLRSLRDEPCRPGELTDGVDATRTTVQRVLSEFTDRNWVVKRGSTYRPTPTGKRVHDAYENLLEELGRADRYGAFAADLERAGVGFPSEGLSSGSLTVAGGPDPLASVDRIVELVREGAGREIRAVSPIVTQRFNAAAADALDDGASVELIIDEHVVTASAENFGEATRRAVSDPDAQVYVASDSLDHGFFYYDDRVFVVGYDDRNNPRSVFESSHSRVVDWADERFERLLADAVPFEEVVDEVTPPVDR